MKRPDLIVLIAVWHFLNAFGAIIGISAIGIFAFPSVCDLWGYGLAGGLFGLILAEFVLLCFVVIAIISGIGLLKGKEWGRVWAIVHAALNLLWIPIGTVIGILVIIYLSKPELKEYFSQEQK